MQKKNISKEKSWLLLWWKYSKVKSWKFWTRKRIFFHYIAKRREKKENCSIDDETFGGGFCIFIEKFSIPFRIWLLICVAKCLKQLQTHSVVYLFLWCHGDNSVKSKKPYSLTSIDYCEYYFTSQTFDISQ